MWVCYGSPPASHTSGVLRQDFRNESLPDSLLKAALEELEELLHQVDHVLDSEFPHVAMNHQPISPRKAGNLNRMGGMKPLLELALGTERVEALRSLALWALGVAVQNNAPVQQELHSLGGLSSLAGRLQDCNCLSPEVCEAGAQYCGKLLFCLSGFLRNSPPLQAEADQLGVTTWMMKVGLAHPAPAIVKKALGYLDTVFAQSPEAQFCTF
eukprot:g3542.t1